jgi:RimJ/RimL family protein N-acetyltransferase
MYKCLKQQTFVSVNYSLVPIRMDDRYDIMQWRNEQIYHLRQKEPLTEVQQDKYFDEVVSKLFDQEKPDQLLFSFLEGENLIGYGGLVHIDWENRNAEISFLQKIEDDLDLWDNFLKLIFELSFKELNFLKIYTYAFDIRPKLYPILELNGFIKEATLVNHIIINEKPTNVVLHSKFNNDHGINRRLADFQDAGLLFDWINDVEVRRQSLNSNPISWENHLIWFWKKLFEEKSEVYLYFNGLEPIGMVRLDSERDSKIKKISYLVSPNQRGKGFGTKMIDDISNTIESNKYRLIAEVKHDNTASNKIFEKTNFTKSSATNDKIIVWQK